MSEDKQIIASSKITLKDLIMTIPRFLKVETKDSEVVDFKLNIKQWELVRHIRTAFKIQKETGQPVRIMILKGRQFGVSTLIIAFLFIKCLLIPNTRAVVISHTEDSTKKLFRKVKFFAGAMQLKPALDKESEKEYSFPRTNSYFYIGTAGTRSFGRGDNITDLHCSEVAFWERPGLVMNGLLQAVGKTGRVFIECTANGMGGKGAYFYKLWKRNWKVFGAAWTALFFKWTDFDEYEMEIPTHFARTREETALKIKHPELTDRKLVWRRWKIGETESEAGLSPEQIFQQEYPLTPLEAFITSGHCIFSSKALLAYKTKEGRREGNLIIYGKPVSDETWMGIDVAEGTTLEDSTEGEESGLLRDRDSHCIQIIDRDLNQVAEYVSQEDTDELADMAVVLGDRFNSFMGCEVNGPGLAVLARLKKIYPLFKQYHREVHDENYKKVTKKLGWHTNRSTTGGTKTVMLNDMVNMVRKHEATIYSEQLIDECLATVKNESGSIDTNGKDRLMAMAVAIQMYKHKPPRMSKITPQEKQKIDKEQRWRAKHKKRAKIKRLMRAQGF